MSKPKLTRRVMRQYQSILREEGPLRLNWMYPHPTVFWKPSSKEVSRGWAAYIFAKKWKSYDINLKKLERIVLESKDPNCMRGFVLGVPGANVKRFQKAIMETLDQKAIKLFMEIPGAHVESLKNFLIILEVMKN